MDSLVVSKDINAESGLISLPIKEVAFMEFERRIDRVIVHTVDSSFFLTGTLKYWQNGLDSNGYNFVAVDRTNVVNLDRIVVLDEMYHIAYFEENITHTSKRCTFTNINFEKAKEKYSVIQKKTSLA
ncbi:MAG: hypothetical protein K0Q73_7603 [Paenibacillus sp.]|nr:hypothetical protein [Paenibacillus sp.]